MEKPQTWFASFIICKTHLNGANVTDVFFIGFYCLLIIITNAITRADAMIVTDTRPAKSNLLLIIMLLLLPYASPPCWRQTTSAYSHFLCSLVYSIFLEKTSEHFIEI